MRIILAFSLFYTITIIAGCQDSSLYRKLHEVAVKLNRNMPQMVDSVTRVDSLVAIPDNILEYNCTLLNSEKDTMNIRLTKNNLEKKMIETIKISPDFKPYRENHVSLLYKYRDINKVLIFSIYITPDKYKSD
jgi:hypothetical protein